MDAFICVMNTDHLDFAHRNTVARMHVYVWHYALLLVRARKEDSDM